MDELMMPPHLGSWPLSPFQDCGRWVGLGLRFSLVLRDNTGSRRHGAARAGMPCMDRVHT